MSRTGPMMRADVLRKAFDRSFAEPRPDAPPALEDLLAIRTGDEPYAIPLAKIDGLYVDKRITPVPGGGKALLGLAGFRGALLPVYDLHVLLGRHAANTPRWLITTRAEAIALAFETYEGHVRAAQDAFVKGREDGFVRTTAGLRAVVNITSVLGAIRHRTDQTQAKEEL